MGSTPRKPPQSKTRTRTNARIVSFDDAKRSSARTSASAPAPAPGSSATQALTQPLGKQKSQALPTAQKAQPRKGAPAVTKAAKAAKASAPAAAKAAKAAGKRQAPTAKRASGRKQSRKEIKIARGAEREGALSMRSEEEIEAEARAQEETRKQEKREASKVRAFSDRMRKKAEARKRARTKAKAERKFDAAYGGDGGKGATSPSAQAAPSEAGPRAAVYEGKMGSSHKKSAKMQAKAAGDALKSAASGISLPKANLSKVPRGVMRAAASVAVVALFVGALYGPAQQYYQQMRETDRLHAEYAAVEARNNTLQSTIDSLSSEEGIEDKAHTDLGYIKKGEYTATVRGANIVDTTEFSSNVAPGSVSAPETWYSPVLDVLFGYSG